MTKEQILKKAIEKAEKTGWTNNLSSTTSSLLLINRAQSYRIIFDHDFAKYFFGEEYFCNNKNFDKEWQYHLQQMVISEDPIKYLSKFLDK